MSANSKYLTDFPSLVCCTARHPGRVFLLHGDSASPPAEELTGADGGGVVMDYAAGWKHAVALVRADDGDSGGDENGE